MVSTQVVWNGGTFSFWWQETKVHKEISTCAPKSLVAAEFCSCLIPPDT